MCARQRAKTEPPPAKERKRTVETKNILLFVYLLGMNAAAYILMAVDKTNAIRKARRIPEAVLLLIAALGGSLGEWLGMAGLHHKTKHKKFLILVPLFLFVHIALGVWLLFFRG